MWSVDDYVLRLTSAIAGKSAVFDQMVVKVGDLYSVKLLPFMTLLVFLWFRKEREEGSRTTVVEAVLGMFLAVLVSRLVQNFLPMRLRPINAETSIFVAPIGVSPVMEHWSSFPSDHAAIAFALATAVFKRSRPLGAICFGWAITTDCLPRLYAGYHYASDVIGGAMIGVGAVHVVRLLIPLGAVTNRTNYIASRYPGLAHAALFVLMFWFSTMFDDVRRIFRGVWDSL